VKEGIFDARESVLEDLTTAHREGLFDDITLTLSDGVKLSTNRFMLACRSPFFATMLYGGLQDSSSDKIEITACDSGIMGRVLDFMWVGRVTLSDMDIPELLDLLETSRLMCLDSLTLGVNNFLKELISFKKIEFEDCLDALDFATFHKFENLTECLLKYIRKNLESVRLLPRFKMLCSDSILGILLYEGIESRAVDLFTAFTVWAEDKDDLPENIRTQLIRSFDLRSFTRAEIQTIVRPTKFFKDQDVFDVLQEKYDQIEAMVTSRSMSIYSLKKKLLNRDVQLQAMQAENELLSERMEIRDLLRTNNVIARIRRS